MMNGGDPRVGGIQQMLQELYGQMGAGGTAAGPDGDWMQRFRDYINHMNGVSRDASGALTLDGAPGTQATGVTTASGSPATTHFPLNPAGVKGPPPPGSLPPGAMAKGQYSDTVQGAPMGHSGMTAQTPNGSQALRSSSGNDSVGQSGHFLPQTAVPMADAGPVTGGETVARSGPPAQGGGAQPQVGGGRPIRRGSRRAIEARRAGGGPVKDGGPGKDGSHPVKKQDFVDRVGNEKNRQKKPNRGYVKGSR